MSSFFKSFFPLKLTGRRGRDIIFRMKLVGIVENVIFQNSENFYTVLDMDCGGKLVTAVGTFPPVSEGDELTMEGEFTTNSKYGEQFVVSEVKGVLPETNDGIMRYLSSGLFDGVGPVTAANIVAKFGSKTFDVLEKSPSLLTEVKGISHKKANAIAESSRENLGMQKAIMFFTSYGITTSMAVKIYKVYGANSEDMVKSNPYSLIADVDGIGFLTADKIALSLGLPKDSEFRVRAAIVHVFKEEGAKNGHTYLPEAELLERTVALLRPEFDFSAHFSEALTSLSLEGEVRAVKEGYALSYYDFMERSTAAKLVKISREFNSHHVDVETSVAEFERVNKISLHDSQKQAIAAGVNGGVTVITGGPGTGKTTIIKAIIRILSSQGRRVCLCAPTGRAAKRMSEATGEEAKTIHRLLDLDFKDGKGHFTFNDETRLPYDAIIVDEVSMADAYVFNALVKAIDRGAGLVIVGDKDQLPSVGAGNVLKDVIASGMFPVCYLSKIYRQGEESLIVTNAHRINAGEMPVLSSNEKDFFFMERSGASMRDTICSLVTSRLPGFAGVKPEEIQVLAPVKKGVSGVNELNRSLQAMLNPAIDGKKSVIVGENTLRQGDKVMQTSNNYQLQWQRFCDDGNVEKGAGVFNGDIGSVSAINAEGNPIVLFDDGKYVEYDREACADLTLAYAISVHKSQGSEFDVVVLAVLPGAYNMMTRNLLYTAITRAKKLVVVVGEKKNVSFMVGNDYTAKRYTLLTEYLYEEDAKYVRLYS